MDITKTAMGVVGLVVAILIVATVAIPMADNIQVTSPEDRVNDSIIGRYAEVTTASVTSVDSVVTIGGEAFTPVNGNALVISDTFVLVYNDGYQWRAQSGNSSVGSDAALEGDWSYNLTSSGWTFVNGSSNYTGDADSTFVMDADGEYCLVESTMVAYMDPGATAYMVNAAVSSGNGAYYAFGEISGASSGEGTGVLTNHLGISTGTMTWTSTSVDGVYTITAGSMTVGSTTLTMKALVEYEYTAKVIGEGGTNDLLIDVVIMLLVIAPVMMAVRLIGGRD